ncbi:hypothetical protein [Methanococcoides sp. FTZ1]|uniref:hypothetical protein n=1 Tax=Methanococcoides sp. FTZ1 TaxID=3439061 RepID=UPI003F86816E
MAKTIGSTQKEKKTIAISAYLLNQSNDMIESGEFSSLSDLITTAMNEFFVHKRMGLCGEMHSVMKAYLQTEEGRELIRSICEADPKAEPVVIAESVEKKTFK